MKKQNKKNKNRKNPSKSSANTLKNISYKGKTLDAVVKESIATVKKTSHIGPDGAAFLEMSLNPFYSGVHEAGGAKIPDGHPQTRIVKLTSKYTLPTGTATSFWVQLLVPDASANLGLVTYKTGDQIVAANTPNAHVLVTATDATLASGLMSGNRTRIVGGGIRINTTGAATSASGHCQAYWTTKTAISAATPTYVQYDSMLLNPIEEDHTLSSVGDNGITVRVLPDRSTAFESTLTTFYNSGVHRANQFLPAIAVNNVASSQPIQVDFLLYMEVEERTSLRCIPPDAVSYEPDWEHLLVFSENQERVVTGHSFKSFIKNVNSKAKSTFNYLLKNKDLIGEGFGLATKLLA